VWLTSEPLRITTRAKELLADEENEFFLSDASVLELSLKYSEGILEMPKTPRKWINEQIKLWNVKSIGITREICYRLAEIPHHHDDPIDRLLIATALTENLYLMSGEENMKKYPVSLLW
jgi:PIN domain nuclease of toxin-antitoxin system